MALEPEEYDLIDEADLGDVIPEQANDQIIDEQFLGELVPVDQVATDPAGTGSNPASAKAYNPSILDKIFSAISPTNKDAAAVELAVRKIAKEENISESEVREQAGDNLLLPDLAPEGEGFVRSILSGYERSNFSGNEAKEKSISKGANYNEAFSERFNRAVPEGWDNMVDSLEVSKFTLGGGDVDKLSKMLEKKMARNKKASARKTPGQVEIESSAASINNTRGVGQWVGGALNALATFLENPSDAAVMTGEQVANSAPTIGLGVTGGGVGFLAGNVPGAVLGGRSGMATGTAAIELGVEVEEMINERLGLSKPTAENIKSILTSKGFDEESRARGLKKGLSLAAIDQIFFGISGKIAAKPFLKGSKTALTEKAKSGAKGVLVDSAGESVGEAGSQQIARGEVDSSDVVLEGLLGLPGSVVTTSAAAMAEISSLSTNRKDDPDDFLSGIKEKVVDDIDEAVFNQSRQLPAPTIVVTPEGVADTEANMQAAQEMGLRGEGQTMASQLGDPLPDGTIDFEQPDMTGIGQPDRGTRGTGEFQNWEGNLDFEEVPIEPDLELVSKDQIERIDYVEEDLNLDLDLVEDAPRRLRSATEGELAVSPMSPETAQGGAGKRAETDVKKSGEQALPPTGELISQIDDLRSVANETANPFVKAKLNRDADILQSKLDKEEPKLAREESAAKRKEYDSTEEPLDMLLRKMGGIDTEVEPDWAGRFAHMNEKGKKNIEQPGRDKGGATLDDVLVRANEEGFDFKDKAALAEAMGKVERGDSVYSNNRSQAAIDYESLTDESARRAAAPGLSPEEAADRKMERDAARFMDEERYEPIIEPEGFKPDPKRQLNNLISQADYHAPDATMDALERIKDDEKLKTALRTILDDKPEPREAAKKGGEFEQPFEYRTRQHNAKSTDHQLTDQQREAFSPEDERDDVTGLYPSRDRIPTMNRARDYIGANKSNGSYVDIDVRNLGGLNSAFTHTGANVHFKAFADIISKHTDGKANVRFRHGGDEMSIVSPTISVDEMAGMMAKAQAEIDQYVKDNSLQDIPHAKHEGKSEEVQDKAKGTGIYFGVSMFDTDITNSEIIQAAEEQTEGSKPKELIALETEDKTDVNTQKTETAGAGRDEPGTSPERAEKADREDESPGAGEKGSATAGEITSAAADAEGDTASEAQIEADNYKKGSIQNLQGMKVSIENAAGTKRRPEWPTLVQNYGDIKAGKNYDAIGADGDALDVFVKKDVDISADNPIYIINQNNPDDSYDESKVMLGFDSEVDAKKGYLDNYTDDFTGFGDITKATPEQFRDWLENGDTTKAYPVEGRAKAEPEKPDDTKAKAILDAANVTGKDRLDVMSKFRSGEYSLDDIKTAYPVEKVDKAAKKPAEKKPVESDQEIINSAVSEYKTKEKVVSYLNGRLGRKKTNQLIGDIDAAIESETPIIEENPALNTGAQDVVQSKEEPETKRSKSETLKGDSGLGSAKIEPTTSISEEIKQILDTEGFEAVSVTGGNANELNKVAKSFNKELVFYRDMEAVGREGEGLGVQTGGAAETGQAEGQNIPGTGYITNGFVNTGQPGTVFLNVDSSNHLLYILGHELGHTLRNDDPTLWAEMAKELQPLIKNWSKYKEGMAEKFDSDTQNAEEIFGDVIGQNFLNSKFWEDMAKATPKLFKQLARKVIDYINKALKIMIGKDANVYVSDMEQARAVVAKTMAKYADNFSKGAYERMAKDIDADYIDKRSADPVDKIKTKKLLRGNGSQVSKEDIDYVMDESRWLDVGLKIGKKTKLYRGSSTGDAFTSNTSSGMSTQGRGLYTTTDKSQAKEYGNIFEMDHSSLPENPIRFTDELNFNNWLQITRERFGFKRISEFEKVNGGNVDEWIRKIDPDIDGVQIGTGKGAYFVKFPELIKNAGPRISYSKTSVVPGAKAKGITRKQVDEAITQFTEELGNPASVDIISAPTKESFMSPDNLRKYGNDQVKGFYMDRSESQGGGAIVLIESDLDSVEDTMDTLRHEWVVHHGLNTFNKADKKKIINRIRSSKGEQSLKKAWAHVNENYGEKSPEKQAEEMLAYMAENKATRLSKLWKDLVLMIQNFLKKIGLINKNRTTKAEIVQFIEDLAARVGAGAEQQTFKGETSYSKKKTDTTKTPEFLNWFGDSKVVDENGEPLVVYHGTAKEFDAFDPDKIGDTYGVDEEGFFFSSSKKEADYSATESAYSIDDDNASGFLVSVFLSLENPLIITAGKEYDAEYGAGSATNTFDQNKSSILSDLEEGGHDGLILIGSDEYKNLYMATEPTQIKSATGNTGAFDPTDPNIMFSKRKPKEVIAEIDSKAKGAAKSVKRWVVANLTKEGGLPKPAFESLILSDSEKMVGEDDVSVFVRDFERDVEKAYGVKYNKMTDEDLNDINDYLAGNKGVALPEGLHRKLDHMRAYLDRLSSAMQVTMVDMLKIEASRLSEKEAEAFSQFIATNGADGYLPKSMQKHWNIYQKIEENKGVYLTRSYQAFDDENWIRKVKMNGDLIARAKAFIAEERPELNDAQVIGAVNAILEKAYDAGNFMTMISKGAKVGSKDTSIITKKKDVPGVIRELLGEYKDPKLNFVNSASKMQWFIANHNFLMNVRNDGLGVFLFEKPENDFSVMVSLKGSESMKPIDGLYTTRDIDDALRAASEPEVMGDIYRNIVKLNSIIKYNKTILSLNTQARNFQSAAGFAVMNGHFNWSYGKKAALVAKSDFFTKDEVWRKYINKLIGMGVIHNSPHTRELKAALEEFSSMNVYQKGSMQWMRKLLDFMQRSYQLGDDFWKIIGYENQLDMEIEFAVKKKINEYLSLDAKNDGFSERLKNKKIMNDLKEKAEKFVEQNMTEELEKKAAYRIRNGYPTYSMVPKGIKKIRRWPLVGTFVSFPWEIGRTTIENAKFIKEDYDAGNTKGWTTRAAGMSIMMSGFYVASMMSMMLLGLDGEDDEAVRKLLPPWARNSQLIYNGYDENGELTYYDASYLDAYTYIKKPLTALVNGNNEGFVEKVTDAVKETLEPFLGVDIAAGAVFEILSNKKDSGGKVYNEQSPGWDKAKAMLNHFRKASQPGTFPSIERMIMALNDESTRSGKRLKVSDEMWALVGHRVNTLSIPTALVYKTYEFIDSKREASMLLSYVSGSSQKITTEQVEKATRDMIVARQRIFKEMIKIVKSAKKLNVSEDDIADLMEASGASKNDVDYILDGEVAPWEVPFSFGEKGLTRALLTARDDKIRAEIDAEYDKRMDVIDAVLDDYYK